MSFRNNLIVASKWLKLFGYATFSVKSIQDVKVSVTLMDFLCLTVNLTAGCILTYFSVVFTSEHYPLKLLLHCVIKVVISSISLVSLISMASVFIFRNKIWKFAKLIDMMDINFCDIGVKSGADFFLKLLIYLFAAVLIFTLIGIALMERFLDYDHSVIQVLLHFIYLSLNFSFCMFWAILFHGAINRRFGILNDVLR